MTDFLIAPWASPRSVTSLLVTGPLEPPFTVAQAKLRAGLAWADGDPRDALMTEFIDAARQKVEFDTGLALIHQTRLVTINAPAGSVMPLPAQALPLISIVEETGTPVAVTVVPSFSMPTPPMARAPRVVFDAVAGTMTLPYGMTGTWRIEAGWPDRATLAREAPLLLHACGLLTAHYATAGRDSVVLGTIAQDVPLTYEDAIQPYRVIWVT